MLKASRSNLPMPDVGKSTPVLAFKAQSSVAQIGNLRHSLAASGPVCATAATSIRNFRSSNNPIIQPSVFGARRIQD